jgi:hypothetical protein
MIYQSDDESNDRFDSEGTETGSDEELRAQRDAEEFPLGHHGVPDSTMLERLGEAEEGGTERTVARDLILQEISKNVLSDVMEECIQRKTASSPSSTSTKRKHGQTKSQKKGREKRNSRRKRSGGGKKHSGKSRGSGKKKGVVTRLNKKIARYDNITGEPTKEYLEKHHNVWKVRKIQRDKRRRGREILDKAHALDQYVVESFVYAEHRFELPYEHPTTLETPHGGESTRSLTRCGTSSPLVGEEGGKSFHEEVARRWARSHPDQVLEFLDEENQPRSYDPERMDWALLPWNQPTEWFLDVSKLIEDDRLCIIQMLYEVTIDPYRQLIESLPLEVSGE